MTISYSLVGDSRGQTLTVIYESGETTAVPSTHANFLSVLGYLVDTPVEDLDEKKLKSELDIVLSAGTALTVLSERVMVSGNKLFFDGEEINSALADHIVRLLREGDEGGWMPLIKFLEKLATNPSQDSRDSLYSWIQDRNITITEDGDFVAYKGVKIGSDGESLSIHAGPGFVDNQFVDGYIPNRNGSVISMSRADVNSNTGIGCSTGLHAGTWTYAKDFARGRILEVHINPRDVVSVPRDCSFQKLRVSRYLVVNEIDQEYSVPTVYAAPVDSDEDDDYYDECDFCGGNHYDGDDHDYEDEEDDEDDQEKPRFTYRF